MATALYSDRSSKPPTPPTPPGYSPVAGEGSPVAAFHRSLSEKKNLPLQLPAPEQVSYHKECLRKSLLSRYAKASLVITETLENYPESSCGKDLLSVMASKITTDAITPAEDLEAESSNTLTYFFAPDVMESFSEIVRPLLEHAKRQAAPQDQAYLEAATMLGMLFLHSLRNTAESFRVSQDELAFYLDTFSSPPFLQLMLDDWPAHMRMCEVFIDALHYMLKDIGTKPFTAEQKSLMHCLITFENLVPAGVRSQQSLGQQYLREFKLHIHLQEFQEAFHKIQLAELAGDFESFFQLALIHLGLQASAIKFANLDDGLKYLALTKQAVCSPDVDLQSQTDGEDEIRQLDGHRFYGTKAQYVYLAGQIYMLTLKRYMGLDCRKDQQMSGYLLENIKHIFPGVYQKLFCLIKVLEQSTAPLPRCRRLRAFDRYWLQGRNQEFRGNYETALSLFIKAADLDSFMAGWAPVRLAIHMQKWSLALEYGKKLLAAWPDDYGTSDREMLLETIVDLSRLEAAQKNCLEQSVDDLTAWINGGATEKNEKNEKKKQSNKKTNGLNAQKHRENR